jgi:hypothetical protein
LKTEWDLMKEAQSDTWIRMSKDFSWK